MLLNHALSHINLIKKKTDKLFNTKVITKTKRINSARVSQK